MLEVLGQTSISVEPSQGSLDDPAAGDDFEALGGVGSLDDLDGPLSDTAQRAPEFVSGIAAVGEQVTQPGETRDDSDEHERRSVAVLDVGSVDHGVDQIALSIGEDVALAALDLLARIIAPRSAAFRGFDALAVDPRRRRAGLATGALAVEHDEVMVDRLEHAAIAQPDEPAVDRALEIRASRVRTH